MDDPSGNTGTLLLGGVNTAKYSGELHTMSTPAVNGVHYLPVALVTSIAVQTNSSVSTNHLSGLPVYMILNTLESFIYLPDSIVEGIYEDLCAWWDGYFQYGRINCSMAQYDYNVTFTLTDFDINIPLRDLILAGDGMTCTLSIAPSGGDAAVLGNTFQSSVYVVHYLSNNEISMAETNFNPGEDNILEIGNGTNPVPGAVSVSTTTSATIPTTFTKPPYIIVFPPTPTVSAVAASSSSPATNSAVLFPPSNLHNLIAGLISTCLLFAL